MARLPRQFSTPFAQIPYTMNPASSHGDSLMGLEDSNTLNAKMARTGPTSLPVGYQTKQEIIEEMGPSRSDANDMLSVSVGNGTGKKRCRKEGVDKAVAVPTRQSKRVKISVSAADPRAGSQDHMISTSTARKLRSVKSKADLSTPGRNCKRSQNSTVSLHKAKASAKTATEESIVEQPKLKPKSPTKTRARVGRNQAIVAGNSKWKLVSISDIPPSCNRKVRCKKEKPRIWTSSKQELEAILPELAGSKCVNGISWLLSDTPILLLDGNNKIGVAYESANGGEYLDVTMIREFVCLQGDLESGDNSTHTLSTNTQDNLSKESKPAVDVPSSPAKLVVRRPRGRPRRIQPTSVQSVKPGDPAPFLVLSKPTPVPPPPPRPLYTPSPLQYAIPQVLYPPSQASHLPHPFHGGMHNPPILAHPAWDRIPPHPTGSGPARTSPEDMISVPTMAPALHSRFLHPPPQAPHLPHPLHGGMHNLPMVFSVPLNKSLSVPSLGKESNPTVMPPEFPNMHSEIRPIAPILERARSVQVKSLTLTQYDTILSLAADRVGIELDLKAAYANPPEGMEGLPVPHSRPQIEKAERIRGGSSAIDKSTLHDFPEAVTTKPLVKCSCSMYTRNPLCPRHMQVDPTPTSSREVHTNTVPATGPSVLVAATSAPPTQAQLPLPTSSNTVESLKYHVSEVYIPPYLRYRFGPPNSNVPVIRRPLKVEEGFDNSECPPLIEHPSHAKHPRRTDHPPHVKPPPRAEQPVLVPSSKLIDDYIPSDIPDEIRVLIDAYIEGKPVVIVSSRSCLLNQWQLLLPEEVGYAYLGYFKITRVLEKRLPSDSTPNTVSVEHVTGKVEWRFRLQWVAGGEEYLIAPEASEQLSHPWWRTNPLPKDVINVPHEPSNDNNNNKDESTPRYLEARKQHLNYLRRSQSLDGVYSSLIPLPLLSTFGPQISDKAFPNGWYCEYCGKLNFQAFLRHRWCTSSSCEGSRPVVNYTQPLERMRDPQQKLPLSLPHDTCPASTDVKVASWQDGMRTLTYTLEEGEVVLKHIFTSNNPSVQTHMTDLLKHLQVDVRLRRLCKDKSLYFSYDAGIPGEGNASTIAWDDAPRCITDARDLLVNHAQWYGEKEKRDTPVNHLSILAWVAAGSQRGRNLISAKKYPVLIMCLGCEVVISLTRKSSRTAKIASLDDLIPLEDGDAAGPLELSMDVDSLPVLTNPTVHKVEEDVDMEATSGKMGITGKAPTRKTQKGEPILVTLVHGDMLMVSGDDFEYSLQRSGTSIRQYFLLHVTPSYGSFSSGRDP